MDTVFEETDGFNYIFDQILLPAANLEFDDTSTLAVIGGDSLLTSVTWVLEIPSAIKITTIADGEENEFLERTDGKYYANFKVFKTGTFDKKYNYVLAGGYDVPRELKKDYPNAASNCSDIGIDRNGLGAEFDGETVFSRRHR